MNASVKDIGNQPQRIGRYIITRELGSGATSRVFLAHDSASGSDVALKLYHGDDVRPERARTRRRLFSNEAHLAGKLDHPNIVRVLDSGESGEHAYIVSEYLRGAESLRLHTRLAGRLSQHRVAELLFACARGLDYAHGHGLVHRDIKASNILVTAEGVPKLIDFGIAMFSGDETRTVTGLLGSPSYMAPEQVRDGEATARSDIYSLGVVGYELLSARLPFYGKNLSHLIHQIMYATPRPLSRLRANVSPALEAIIARAMEKDPERRYPNVQAMAVQLARAVSALKNNARKDDFDTRFDIARHLPFFRDFGYGEVWDAVSHADWLSYEEGSEVSPAGDNERALYIVVSGEVTLGAEGRRADHLHRGDTFGELSLLTGRPRVTTARATLPTRLIRLDASQLAATSNACQLAFYKFFNEALVRRITGN